MMNGDEPTRQSFSLARRWSALLNLIVSITAVLALVAMSNYLAVRHYQRWHWNRVTEAELSQRTRLVLATLTNTVKVTAYYDSDDKLFPRVKGLLKEYQFASPKVQVQFVDYLRDVPAARKLKLDYKLNAANEKDVVIFDMGGRVKVVSSGELSDYDYSKLLASQTNEVERTHFKGELLFTSAIFAVANERKPVAYYLLGNGEHLPGGDNPDSYGKFLALLHDENNFVLHPLILGGTNEVPANCNLLIIAGPTQPLDAGELEKIQRHLDQGGRALIAFNRNTVTPGRRTGLERLLTKWGVEVGNNAIYDRENSISSSGLDLVPANYGGHPIVNPLANSRIILSMPRSIRAAKPSGGRNEELKVTELLFTGPRSVVEVNTHSHETDPSLTGSHPLMVAVEKNVPALQRGATRLVVLGDSSLWGNGLIEVDANRDFAAFTANWLVNQQVLLNDIPRREIQHYQLSMTRAQMRSAQLVLLLGLPGGVILLGALVWLRRRH